MIWGHGGHCVGDTGKSRWGVGRWWLILVLLCVVCFLAPNYVLYFAPLTVVQIFNPLTLPSEKKVVKMTLCTTGCAQLPPKYPSF
jgi:hypothetical protein